MQGVEQSTQQAAARPRLAGCLVLFGIEDNDDALDCLVTFILSNIFIFFISSIVFRHIFLMIRRNPTLIPLTDEDVQDVRDMVAKQKADLQNHQQLMVKMKRLADNPNMSKEDMEMLEQIKGALSRTEKNRRLGLEPGQFAPARKC